MLVVTLETDRGDVLEDPSGIPEPLLTHEPNSEGGRHRDQRCATAPRLEISRVDGVEAGAWSGGEKGQRSLYAALGTASPDFATGLVELLGVACSPESNGLEESVRALNGALGALHGSAVRDELEAMLVSQMAACHVAAMRHLDRLRTAKTEVELKIYEKAANGFMRTYTMQLDALKRYRSKGEQTIRVERVYVGPGGQAIVGNVGAPVSGRGAPEKNGDQPHESAKLAAPNEAPMSCSLETDPETVRQRSGSGQARMSVSRR